MINKIFLSVCILLVFLPSAQACVNATRVLKTKKCQIEHNINASGISWESKLKSMKVDCGLNSKEIDWLVANVPIGSQVFEQSDKEFYELSEKIKAEQVEKTAKNAVLWEEIDKMNSCGKKIILNRYEFWTVVKQDPCKWKDKKCLCPKC